MFGLAFAVLVFGTKAGNVHMYGQMSEHHQLHRLHADAYAQYFFCIFFLLLKTRK